jgi:hypothetical protein
MPKTVKQAKKEGKQLRASVKSMLQDRLDRGKPIPARAKKNFPKLKTSTKGTLIGKAVKSGKKKKEEALKYN